MILRLAIIRVHLVQLLDDLLPQILVIEHLLRHLVQVPLVPAATTAAAGAERQNAQMVSGIGGGSGNGGRA